MPVVGVQRRPDERSQWLGRSVLWGWLVQAGGLDQGAWAGAGGADQKQQQWDGDRRLQLLTRNMPSMVTGATGGTRVWGRGWGGGSFLDHCQKGSGCSRSQRLRLCPHWGSAAWRVDVQRRWLYGRAAHEGGLEQGWFGGVGIQVWLKPQGYSGGGQSRGRPRPLLAVCAGGAVVVQGGVRGLLGGHGVAVSWRMWRHSARRWEPSAVLAAGMQVNRTFITLLCTCPVMGGKGSFTEDTEKLSHAKVGTGNGDWL